MMVYRIPNLLFAGFFHAFSAAFVKDLLTGKEAEYGQTEIADILTYFVIPNLLAGIKVRRSD